MNEEVEPDDIVTSTSDQLDMLFVTPSVNKLMTTAAGEMTATGVTGRRLKDGERYMLPYLFLCTITFGLSRPVMKYLYVSDVTGSPIVSTVSFSHTHL